MIDELGRNPRILQVLLDRACVLFVDLLRARRRALPCLSAHPRESKGSIAPILSQRTPGGQAETKPREPTCGGAPTLVGNVVQTPVGDCPGGGTIGRTLSGGARRPRLIAPYVGSP